MSFSIRNRLASLHFCYGIKAQGFLEVSSNKRGAGRFTTVRRAAEKLDRKRDLSSDGKLSIVFDFLLCSPW